MSDLVPVLETTGVFKSFPSGDGVIDVLHGVAFAIHSGQSVSIRGESGCGKSTFLNIIAGLETLDSGSVSWQGMNIESLSASKRARIRAGFLGMVFQAFYLVPEINALENVTLAARIHGGVDKMARSRAERLMIRVGLGERLKSTPAHLSGGERQRVALARALMNSPRLILADEPTGNLDEKTASEVMDLLLDICLEEKSSLVLVTHNPGFAKRTDRTLTLHKGLFQ